MGALCKSNPASAKHGNLLEENNFHSMSLNHPQNEQFFGDAWEWTASAYLPYPGFKPLNGALGEYNGKFMNNQIRIAWWFLRNATFSYSAKPTEIFFSRIKGGNLAEYA